MIARAALVAGLAFASPLAALELALTPNARLTVERNTAPDSYSAPVGVFADGKVPELVVEGQIDRSVWRIEAPGLTPLQVMRPLRDQIEAAGYSVILDCAAETCGGYDFRFATETLPGPNMYVNIRAFHFLTAIKGPQESPREVVTILSSSSASSAYAQVIRASTILEQTPADTAPVPSDDFAQIFLAQGHIVLSALEFNSGTSDLGQGPFPRLAALAAFLKERPTVRIALVGHTDTVGGLNANIALSRLRAQSVRERLISAHGIAPDRVEAEGVGYLAPVASNQTAQGRDANRRVEAVLLGE